MVHRVTSNTFQKIGWCNSYDVLERFSAKTSVHYGNSPNQYSNYTIRVLASAHFDHIEDAKVVEASLKLKYPKNLRIDDYFVGITEIVKLDSQQRKDVINYIRALHKPQHRSSPTPAQDSDMLIY